MDFTRFRTLFACRDFRGWHDGAWHVALLRCPQHKLCGGQGDRVGFGFHLELHRAEDRGVKKGTLRHEEGCCHRCRAGWIDRRIRTCPAVEGMESDRS